MVGSNTIHCARADTVMPSVTSASARNLFMVCLSLCCRCRRQHAANHEKGFTTERTRCGVSGRFRRKDWLLPGENHTNHGKHNNEAFRKAEFQPFCPRQKLFQ